MISKQYSFRCWGSEPLGLDWVRSFRGLGRVARVLDLLEIPHLGVGGAASRRRGRAALQGRVNGRSRVRASALVVVVVGSLRAAPDLLPSHSEYHVVQRIQPGSYVVVFGGSAKFHLQCEGAGPDVPASSMKLAAPDFVQFEVWVFLLVTS